MQLNLLETALLLGVFVLLAGCYGLLYGVGKLARRRSFMRAGLACYGSQCAIAIVVVAVTPLAPAWKVLVVASTIACLVIPPITWRFLARIH